MLKIDFENHFYDPSLLEELSKRQQSPFYRKETNMITWTDAITMPQDFILPQLAKALGVTQPTVLRKAKSLGITKW